MKIIPSHIDSAVVLDLHDICTSNSTGCRVCPEQAVGIHNWLMNTGIRYIIVDFQDEKDVCKSILVELLQLRKRLHIPFIFVGLMDRPKRVLTSYAYTGYPFFAAPEEATQHLRKMHPDLLDFDMSKVDFGTPIPSSRTRHQRQLGEDTTETEDEDYDQEESGDESSF